MRAIDADCIKLIGIYDEKRYEIPRHVKINGDGKRFTGMQKSVFYGYTEAFGIARWIAKTMLVPDGSPFNHYFDKVEVYMNDVLYGWANSEVIWRNR